MLREEWEQRGRDDSQENIDCWEDGEGFRPPHDVGEVVDLQGVDDVDTNTVEEVGTGHPHQLIIPREGLEDTNQANGILLILPDIGVDLPGEDPNAPGRDQGQKTDDQGKHEPTTVIPGTGLGGWKVDDGRHDNNPDQTTTDGWTNPGEGSGLLPLPGVSRQWWQHRPEADILEGIEDVHRDVEDGKYNQVGHRALLVEAAHVGEQQQQDDGRDRPTNNHPWPEVAPPGLGAVDRVPDERVDEQFDEAEKHDG